MDVAVLQNEKTELEGEILALLEKFEKRTQVTITEITFQHRSEYSMKGGPRPADVKVVVIL